MKELNLVQGSPEWKAARLNCFTASEAPAMMGVSKYKTRSALIREKATGIVPDIDAATQSRFDKGHEAEAAARPLAEAIIGQELYPVTATTDCGKYLASSDGATMLCDIGFEHKLVNADLVESVKAGTVPDSHKWQLVHQTLVFGFERIMFCVSDGTPDNFNYCWFSATNEDIDRLIAGWEQFDKDVAAYVPEETKPEVIGHAPDQLPALCIEVTGMVTASNLEQFKTAALSVFRGINTSLKTDQDFADAEKAVKFCKNAEERVEAAKAHALSQTVSIDDLFKTMDAVKEEARTVRLKLEKLLKSEKESRKAEIVTNAQREMSVHLSALHGRVGVPFSFVYVGFAEAIKGLKSVDSMKDKVSSALANAKVEANAIADRIEANRKTVEDMSLFPDFAQVCMKPSEDFAALLNMRVNQRKEAEERRLEAERQRIRAEEEAKARAKLAAEQSEANRLAAEAQAKAQQEERERVAAELAAKRETDVFKEVEKIAEDRLRISEQSKPVATAEVTPIRPVATSADAKQLRLGEISAALGFTVTAEFMAHLGLHPSATEKAAKLYAVTIATVCRLIQEHLARVMKESLAA